MHKMPYKHIAAYLKKTELACRLHYHQMSYGSGRRRRTDSVSSTGSFGSVAGPGDSSGVSHYTQLSPVVSPCSSPEMASQKLASSETSPFQQQRAPIPILPKPEAADVYVMHSTSSNLTKALRLDTSFRASGSHQYLGKPSLVDLSRVRALYEAHRASFWSVIAAEYSRDPAFGGQDLEEAFFTALCSPSARATSPPTPGPSPDSSPEVRNACFGVSPTSTQGFHAVNQNTSVSTPSQLSSTPSSADRCSVSSLLTVEREVRPSRKVDAERNA
jgi:hypothetical protein